METRIARLESDVEYIKRDIGEIKTDLREIRGDYRQLFLLGIGACVVVLGVMAKGFGWL